jgi:hypothetical protein
MVFVYLNELIHDDGAGARKSEREKESGRNEKNNKIIFLKHHQADFV